jgi:predicted ferric reductase
VKPRGAALVLFLYLLLPGVQIAVYLGGLPFADPVDLVAFTASIAAYHWMVANVILSLKLPLFQASLPYDLRIRIHIFSTLGLTALLAGHAAYTIFLKAMAIDAVAWGLMGLFTALVLLSVLWIPLPGLKAFRTRVLDLARVGFLKSYDALKAGHKVLFLVLAALTYVHLLQSHLLGIVPAWSTWGYHGLFLTAAGLFLWTRIHNFALPTLEVRSVVEEGGIVRLTLEPHRRLRYRAGQFAFLRFEYPELQGEEHPFSFTSAHHEGEVGFAVRALGDFTSKLTRLQPGDRVRINGGFGDFRPRAGSEPLALIGSGIGAAPLVSILKELGQRAPDREVVCLLSVNRREELVEQRALEDLAEAMPHLKLKVFVFNEDGELYGPQLMARELQHPKRYRYYLCSSEKVRSIVVGALRSLGVPGRKIHFEAFSLG